jgi:hypothetical protein
MKNGVYKAGLAGRKFILPSYSTRFLPQLLGPVQGFAGGFDQRAGLRNVLVVGECR